MCSIVSESAIGFEHEMLLQAGVARLGQPDALGWRKHSAVRDFQGFIGSKLGRGSLGGRNGIGASWSWKK